MAKLFFSTDDLAHGHFSRTKGEFSWRLTKAGCLTIEGTGELHQDIESCHGNSGDGWDSHFDWDETEWPWHTDILIPKVEKVVIGEGITSICAYAFRNYPNLKEVAFPDTLDTIEQEAFSGTQISQVRLPKYLTYMGRWVFSRTPLAKAAGKEFCLDGWQFKEDRTIKIPHTANIIPSEDNGSAVWSYSTFKETEATYRRAKAHPNGSHLMELLDYLKEGAMDDALNNCRLTETKYGRLTPSEFMAQNQITKEMTLLRNSTLTIKSFEKSLRTQTICIVFRPQNGFMAVTALGLLRELEEAALFTDSSSAFTVNFTLPKELHDQKPFQALLEIINTLFPWIAKVNVATTEDHCPYLPWYMPVVKDAEQTKPLENGHQGIESASKPSLKNTLYCRKCGAKLPPDSVYCYKCGTKVITSF